MSDLYDKVCTWENLHLASRCKWMSPGQYRHAAMMVAELGRLLGGWIRQTAG